MLSWKIVLYIVLIVLQCASSFRGAPSRRQAQRLMHMGQLDGLKDEIKSSSTTLLKKSSAAAKGLVDVVSEVKDMPATPETVGVLTDKINAEKDPLKASTLKTKRYLVLSEMLRVNRELYLETVSFFASQIPRSEVPNLQDVAYYNATYQAPKELSVGDLAYLNSLEIADLVESSSVQNTTFSDSILDTTLLSIFRGMVQEEVSYKSPIVGIKGLLDEGRTYMLSDRGTQENQHKMVRTVLGGLLTPFLPPFYRIFMAGIVPCKENGDPEWLVNIFASINKVMIGDGKKDNEGPLAPGKSVFGGPLFYAPFLTSVVTPPFLKFLVGPSRTNYRKDGQLGGIVVEKCKFLQESGCKGLCLHQCKLPAQQFFADSLKLPVTVSPDFATQECQWSWGEEPLPPEDDPAWPKGCLVDCPTRSIIKSSSS